MLALRLSSSSSRSILSPARTLAAVRRASWSSSSLRRHLHGPHPLLMSMSNRMPDTGTSDSRPVFFFDVDNTLYSKNRRVQDLMGDLIDKYFMEHLSLSQHDAFELHQRYYKEYGLAIEGLVRHHKVDPLDYNSKVDDALPLEDVLQPDEPLRKLLLRLDTQKVKPWLFTNAYVTHGRRVARLLGIDDLFEGITYCDYGAARFVCKPHPDMFRQAERDAGVADSSQCFFVDDSALNCRAAETLGWTAVHMVEETEPAPTQPASKYQIRSLHQLPELFPHFFKH